MTATWEASFGDLDFSPAAQHGEVTVEVHGLQRGKHTRITAVADSLIQDGSIERVVRDDNRDVQLILCLDGSDSEALAQYEATLFREVNRGRNEFRWTPPDGFGATAVFDVLWADLAFADEGNVWDLDEIRGRRNYVLTMRCLPFARSVEPFTVAGVTSGATPTTVVINDGSSLTGWSGGGYTGGVTSDGNHVSIEVKTGFNQDNGRLFYTPATPIDMTGTPYLSVTYRTDGVGAYDYATLGVIADGAPLARVAAAYVGGAGSYGYYTLTYSCPDLSVGLLEIDPYYFSGHGDTTTGLFQIDKIERTNQAPSTGTLRQKMVSADVPGSARTPASLEVAHATSGLGNVLVYNSASGATGYSPPLSRYRTDSPGNDSTTVSGKRGTGGSYSIPAALLPAGLYQLVIRRQTTGTSSASAALQVGGVDVGAAASGSKAVELMADDGTGYNIQSLGTFNLPPHEVPAGTSASVRLTLTSASGTGQVDEAWLFHMPDDGSAHLSAIPAGTNKRVWLDAPTIDRPYPMAYVGNAADRSDSYGVNGATSNWDEHVFPAGSNEVFVVTTTALDAQVELEGFAHWLTHPAA